LPSDGNPRDIEDTAIPINFVSERLRRCGADNVVLILDACRSQGIKGEGIGRQTEDIARTTGVISIFSCSPNEYSYEIDILQQGAFTRALLEGLGIRGQCATVERLNQYLNFRVPQLVRQHKNARQTPYMIAEPVNKSHLILVPKYATLADIATLKNDAYCAKDEGDIDLAEQLWIRVLAAASGHDMEAIKALQRIALIRHSQLSSANLPPTVESGGKSKALTPPPTSQPENVQPPLNSFSTTRVLEVIFSSLKNCYSTQNWWIRDNKFQMCIEAILSQGTSWENVELAINNLKDKSALTPNAINEISLEHLGELMKPFGRIKTSYVKNFVLFLKENYELNVEQMLAEETTLLRSRLLRIKGIGEFTCDNILLYTADKRKLPINNRIRKVFFEHDLIESITEPYDSV